MSSFIASSLSFLFAASRFSFTQLAKRLFLSVVSLLIVILLAATSRGTAQTQQPTSSGNQPCASPAMLSLLSRVGNSIQVSSALAPNPEPLSRKHDSSQRENEQGTKISETPQTRQTLRRALDLFEKGARKGYAPAQVNLAVFFLGGWGTPSDSGAAVYWLTEAARQAYPLAYFDLGILYQNGCGVHQDYSEAAHYFQLGADANDASSQMNLGYLYDQGLGVRRDRAQAAALYRKAAEAGLASAQFNLADLYAHGGGVPIDEPLAFSWFQKAAVQGHTTAQLMLAAMYVQGRGIPKDLATAYAWLTVAQLQGDSRGRATLAALELQLTLEQRREARSRAESLAQPSAAQRATEFASLP